MWRKLPYAVLIASLLVFGFFPKLLTEKIKPVTEQIVNMATAKFGEAVVDNRVLNRTQGEGERPNTSKADQSLLTSAATKSE
jgi:hypothetical protein